ncbi:hypothetical protein PG993_012478 [Apiospora rasikravindrae]|uniref:Uncharacterized protein n=1 Tax=Apiospora rasikravindrae TaxID=990691 RepID=A0ABR1S3W3_9PEZI
MAPSGQPLPLANRRPAYGIYFEPEPRYAKHFPHKTVPPNADVPLIVRTNSDKTVFRVAQVKSWRSLAWTTWCIPDRSLHVPHLPNLLALMLLDGEPAWLCLLCCKIDVLFNAVVLFWVTRTDSRDITTTSSRNKSDSARSRVTRLSFYTAWIRANMGQGPHPGRPFIIPPTPTSPLMGGGADGNNSPESGGGGGAGSGSGSGSGSGGTPSVTHNTHSKGDNRRASINATATTSVAAAAESSQSIPTKAPTKSILKPPPPGTGTTEPAAARFAYESNTEIWTGPGGCATEAAGPGIPDRRSDEDDDDDDDKEGQGTDPPSETSATATSTN